MKPRRVSDIVDIRVFQQSFRVLHVSIHVIPNKPNLFLSQFVAESVAYRLAVVFWSVNQPVVN